MRRPLDSASRAWRGRALRTAGTLLLAGVLLSVYLACGRGPTTPKQRMLAFAQALAPSRFSSPASCFSPAVRSRDDWPQIKQRLEQVREAVGGYRGDLVEVATVRDGKNDLDYTSSGTYTAQYDCGKVVFEATLQYVEGGWFIKQVRITTPQDTWLLPLF